MKKLYLLTVWQNGETQEFNFLFTKKKTAKEFFKEISKKYEDGKYLGYDLKKIKINKKFNDIFVEKTIKKIENQFFI